MEERGSLGMEDASEYPMLAASGTFRLSRHNQLFENLTSPRVRMAMRYAQMAVRFRLEIENSKCVLEPVRD
jgi:hypothetical protein